MPKRSAGATSTSFGADMREPRWATCSVTALPRVEAGPSRTSARVSRKCATSSTGTCRHTNARGAPSATSLPAITSSSQRATVAAEIESNFNRLECKHAPEPTTEREAASELDPRFVRATAEEFRYPIPSLTFSDSLASTLKEEANRAPATGAHHEVARWTA